MSGSIRKADTYLVRTSSLHRLMTHDSSNRTGNQPRTHTRSVSETVPFRSWSPTSSRNIWSKQQRGQQRHYNHFFFFFLNPEVLQPHQRHYNHMKNSSGYQQRHYNHMKNSGRSTEALQPHVNKQGEINKGITMTWKTTGGQLRHYNHMKNLINQLLEHLTKTAVRGKKEI